MNVEQAIKRVLCERNKPIRASELAREAVGHLTDTSWREAKSAIWRMVDEQKLIWDFNHKICLP